MFISKTTNKNIEKIQKDFQSRFIFYERDISDHQEMNKLLEHEQKKYMPFSFAICNAGVRSRQSIEKSNLSRQFLFRNNMIGKLKSECASNAVKEMNNNFSVF